MAPLNPSTRNELATYLASHKILDLMSNIMSNIVQDIPDDPVEYIKDYVNKKHIQVAESPEKSSMDNMNPDERKIMDGLQRDHFFQQMCSELEDYLLLVKEFEIQRFDKGEKICREGVYSDKYVIVLEGKCISTQGGRVVCSVPEPCGTFGAYQLISHSNSPTTLEAAVPSRVAVLSKRRYAETMISSATRIRENAEEVLKRISLLSSLSDNQLHLVAESLVRVTFVDGETIISQGDVGDCFYIVRKGLAQVSVEVTTLDGKERKVLGHLKDGQFFGEVALITDLPRQATVTAVGKCFCLRMNKDYFERLLGPCREVLKKNVEKYNIKKPACDSQK